MVKYGEIQLYHMTDRMLLLVSQRHYFISKVYSGKNCTVKLSRSFIHKMLEIFLKYLKSLTIVKQ